MRPTKKTVSLSKYLGVDRRKLEEAGVFDATLGIDTELFVDPKLLVDSTIEEFKNSRVKILRYFQALLRIHKQSAKVERLRNKARDMLAVPEPEGLSIGYGSKSDNGTSVKKTVANRILLSASEIITVGIEDAEVVELLGLFVEGFGPDSISDLIVTIIYEDFCEYTQRVSSELGVKTKEYKIEGIKYQLPTHPFSNKQLIFLPYVLLRVLPIATSYSEIVSAAKYNDDLRKQLDDIVFPSLEEFIKDASDKSSDELWQFKQDMGSLLDIYQKIKADSYSLKEDKRGYYNIDPFVEKESQNIKASRKPSNPEELIESVRELVGQFKRSLEDNGGNNLLYHRTETGKVVKEKPHREDVAQRVFYMIADSYCNLAEIMLAGESDSGRGPVDFALGTGYSQKVLVEVKKSNNQNLEDGFKKQVEAYQKSENAIHSFYVVIIVEKQVSRKGHISQLDAITALYEENQSKGVKGPELIIVDGLIHPSPSKLRSKNDNSLKLNGKAP